MDLLGLDLNPLAPVGPPRPWPLSEFGLDRQSRAPNLMAAARGIVARSGIAGLYRGNLVNVLRSAPQKSLDFFAFDMFKVSCPHNKPTSNQ